MEEKHPIETMMLNGATFVCARIAAVKDLELTKTEEGFKDYNHYIISEEIARNGKLHQHLLLSADEISETSVTKRIKEIYPDASGNKCLYVKLAKNTKQAMKYTVKEGNFRTKGFSSAYVEDMQKLSRSKEDMQKKFTKLEEQVLLKQITFRNFMKEYILLKVLHSQPLYDNHITAYFKRIGIQSGSMDIDEYVEKLEMRLNS